MRGCLTCTALGLALAGCGAPSFQPAASATKERYDVAAESVNGPAAQAFVANARAIADAGSGTFSINELVELLPMQPDQRQLLLNAYPDDLTATCVGGICTAAGAGRPVEALLEITAGLIRDPLLGLQSQVQIQFVKRGDSSLELCNAQGLYLRKSFIRKKLQGLFIDGTKPEPAVTVQVGDDSQNYTCI